LAEHSSAQRLAWLRWNDLALRTKGLAVIAIPLVPLLISAGWLVLTVQQERRAQTLVTHTLLSRSRSNMDALGGELAEIARDQDRLLAERMSTASRAQDRLVRVTVGGALLGLLGGVIAAIAFTAGVTRRLDLVRDNADRLARGEPMASVLAGEDEVAHLANRLGEAGALMARHMAAEKRTAQELQARVTELAVVNCELEAFSYSVSHDLRAPLRHVTGFASLLDRHAAGTLDVKGRRYLKTIADAATGMGRLIDDLLTFSRMGRARLAPRPVDLVELVRDVQREVTVDLSARDIVWTVGDLPTVQADPTMLRVVLTNLLSNAVKYTSTRPRAQIEVGIDGEPPGELVIFVRDNGVGFDPQYMDKLFGVFQRLHSGDEFDGTGIGLANVRRIIHRHGGRTWADGTVDRGATFYFSLPAVSVQMEAMPA
jgi:signal transduction histidine kinase